MSIPSPSPQERRGRTRSERTDHILELCFQGEDANKLLGSLTPAEQQVLWDDLEELKDQKSVTEVQSERVDFLKPYPTMQEFIMSDYYLGSTLKPSEDYPGLYPAWHEILVRDFNYESRIHNAVITGSLGVGKCHRAGDRVLLYDGGEKAVERVRPGDWLIGDDGKKRVVYSITDGEDELFEVRPAKGEAFCVNADHILCLVDGPTGRIFEVAVKDYLVLSKTKKTRLMLYRVPVNYPHRQVTLDPYWLGLWLGDGGSTSASVTNAEPVIRAYHVQYAAKSGLKMRHVGAGKATTDYASSGRQFRGQNPLYLRLASYGLISNKHVPDDYLYTDSDTRREVLAGLIDTDGHFVKNACYEISTKWPRLAENIAFLARSLGYAATVSEIKKRIKSTGFVGLYKLVFISGADDLPCRIVRKKPFFKKPGTEDRPANPKNPRRSSFKIVPTGRGRYYGFTLSGNGRYLMRDCTVTHNTTVMVAIMLYRIVLTTLLRNPHSYFRLSPASNIIFNILSVTREQVRMTAFGNAIKTMAMSPYFLEDLAFDPDMEYSKSVVPFRNNIYLTAGSKGWHVLGQNVLGIGMDEGNFRLEKDPDKKAYALFDEVRTRISSRFKKVEGFLPAISLLASSASDESSFTETVIKEIEKVGNPSTQAVYRLPIYQAKRHELTLGRRWFKVSHGLRNMDPFILNGWYLEDGSPIVENGPHEEAPKGARTELVPELYWDDFRRNCLTNLQSVSGISTGGSHRLFSSMVDVERNLELSGLEGTPNPLKGNIRYIPMSVEDNLNIWDYLDHPKFLTRIQSRVQPIRSPTCLRYAHMDLATTSKAGLAVCHLVRPQKVEGVIRDGLPFDEYRLVVEYDFILTITAGQVKPINFDKICKFFFWLRDMCGFRFGKVTADWFQSTMPLQTLEAGGFATEQQSLHKNKAAYVAWRTGFEDLRMRLYRSEEMIDEAEKLMETEKDFQHPDNGSDDTTDACAGAYFNAVNSDERTTLLTQAVPSVYTNSDQDVNAQAGLVMEIPMPTSTYRTVKTHTLR